MTTAERRLERARGMADLLDDAVELPVVGYSVGLDWLVGLLPVAGDAVTGLAALYIIYESVRAGVPKLTLARMLLNVLVDVGVGSVPVVGDVVDVVWKSNQRNVDLLADHVESA